LRVSYGRFDLGDRLVWSRPLIDELDVKRPCRFRRANDMRRGAL